MNFFLLVTIVLVIAFMAMVVLRRKRKKASRSGRYRSPLSGGLMLERPGRKGRKLLAGFRLQPRHVLLSLVVAIMGGWLGAGFFMASEEGSSLVAEKTADAALPEQFSYIGGRLTPESVENGPAAAPVAPPRPAASVAVSQNAPAPVQPLAASDSIRAGASSTLATASRLDQVGLMPGQSGKKAAPAKKVPAKAPQALVSSAEAPKPAAVQAATAKAETKPAPAQAAAAPAPAKKAAPTAKAPVQEKPKLATAKPAPQKGLLASSRLYTVHLGSFGEKGNAENYLAQLAQAGEQAFISESTVDGRLWHRVMSGRFSSRDDAENYGRSLKKRGLTIETGRYLVKSID